MVMIKDVVVMVGVLFMIVLYVVNNLWLVFVDVCVKVEGVICELNYVLLVVVCLLKVWVMVMIGFVVLNSMNLYFVEFVCGIED